MNRIKIRPGVRLQIAAQNGYRCSVCDQTLGPVFHIDHVVALCNGGDNSLCNLQAVCPNCHAAKTAIDTQRFWDKQTEIRTGVSRFFNPMAYEYLPQTCPRVSIRHKL